jgi:hypothetical protein
VSALLTRLAAFFVEPRRGESDRGALLSPPAARRRRRDGTRDRRALARASVVVVGDRGAARAAAALAAALARAGRAPFALLCVWGADRAPFVMPPLPATAAAATKLRARGHDARGFGRVLSVALSGADDEALAETARAAAAVAGRRDVPLVLALCAPRSADTDACLGEHDLVVVATPAGSDTLLASIAADRLSGQHAGLAVVCAELPASTHRLAPPPRAAVRSALEALR